MSSFDKDLVDSSKEAIDKMFGSVKSPAMDSTFMQRNNTLLYSKDYSKVIPLYFSNATRSVNKYRYKDAFGVVETYLDNLDVPPETKKLLKEQYEYAISPARDMGRWRSFNFFWGLGGNFSTAMLQLLTLPIQVNAVMLMMGGNPVSNLGQIGDAFSKVSSIMAKNKFDIVKFMERDNLAKHFDKDTAEALRSAYELGQFAAHRSEDLSGKDSFSSANNMRSNGFPDWMADALGASKQVLGLPIETAEKVSRISAFLAIHNKLQKEPNALNNIRKELLDKEDVYNAQRKRRLANGLTDNTHAAMYLIDATHGIFGKLGRGKNQQGIFGTVLFPFMQHPLMMMGLFVRMAQAGVMGKQAAAYTIFATMMLAGLYGIPGWELWKELIEMMYKQGTGGIEIDLHNELKKISYAMTNNPAIGEGMTEGILKPLGIDMARRVGQPIFFQDALIPFLQGQDSIDSFTGVAGSYLRTAGRSFDQYKSGEMGAVEAIGDAVMPVALRNFTKANMVYPNEGVRTAKGIQVMTPEEWTMPQRIAKMFGFQPSQLSREYEKRNAERLGVYGYRLGKTRLVNKIGEKRRELVEARNEKDWTKAQEIKKEIKDLYKKLYKYSRKANEVTDGSWRDGVRRSINTHMMNAKHPDRPIKDYKVLKKDKDLRDYLYERDDD
jgi:hypothetical protein